jgi:xanthine/uracil/vitamin C permease (AzgA family)
MMTPSNPDQFWIILKLTLSVILSFLFCALRSTRKKSLIDAKDLTSISVSVTGVVLAFSLFLRSISSSQILDVLKEDIIALCLGALAQGLASIDTDLKEDSLFLASKLKSVKSKSSRSSKPSP